MILDGRAMTDPQWVVIPTQTRRLEELRMAHDWSDEDKSTERMLKEQSLGISTVVCTKCGCTKIVNLNDFRIQYKPAAFALNPFKTLKSEPPCPAAW